MSPNGFLVSFIKEFKNRPKAGKLGISAAAWRRRMEGKKPKSHADLQPAWRSDMWWTGSHMVGRRKL